MDQRCAQDNSGSRAVSSGFRAAFCRQECATLPFCERVVRIPRDKYLPSRNRKVQVPKNPTTIGGHLRKRRLQLKIFPSEAARRLDVSTLTLSKWECDKEYPFLAAPQAHKRLSLLLSLPLLRAQRPLWQRTLIRSHFTVGFWAVARELSASPITMLTGAQGRDFMAIAACCGFL